MKTFTITQFLTEVQIQKAVQLFAQHGTWDAVTPIQTQVIEPNLAAINEKLGQENDARYLAYGVVYLFMRASAAAEDEEKLS